MQHRVTMSANLEKIIGDIHDSTQESQIGITCLLVDTK